MRTPASILGLICLSAFAAAAWSQTSTAPTRPAAKAPRPTTDVPLSGCVTPACHANIKSSRVLHGPVNVDACDACHRLTSAKEHTFAPARQRSQECSFCHQLDLGDAVVVHKPLQDGQCRSCHDPHGGADQRFLRTASMTELCNQCHLDLVGGRSHVHGPAAAGACEACHQAHAAPLPKLLVREGRELCLSCHTQMREQLGQVRFTHQAVQAECTSCHDPHASNYPMQTLQPPIQLCTATCHEPIRTNVRTAAHQHAAVRQDQACLNCHNAHGGDLAHLMKDQPLTICMSCHNKPVQTPDRTVGSIAEVMDAKQFRHGPIRQGDCGGCHSVHGSDISRLLNGNYPDTFYTSFQADKYGLCFSCHNQELALRRETADLTNFRNGTQNLHYLHVNKDRQGRSCRACHSTHASNNPVHVREAVPYGNWQMPVRFIATANGGRCAAGCHREYAYDRLQPVDNQAGPAPASAPANAKE